MIREEKIDYKKLIRYSLFYNTSNLKWILLSSFLISVFSAFIPIISNSLINQGILNTDQQIVSQLVLVLLCAAVGVGIFSLIANMLIVRFETMANYNLQVIILTRLLKMPFDFFKKFSTGDLTNRILGISMVARVLSGNNISAILTFVFSITNIAVMFYYAPLLAFIVLLFSIILITIYITILFKQFPWIIKITNQQGMIMGFLYQVIYGISRIKVFNKESPCLETWFDNYINVRKNIMHTYVLGLWSKSFFTTSRLSALVIIFLVFNAFYYDSQSVSNFFAFNTAFIQFMVSALILQTTAREVIYSVVYYHRLKPLLTEVPEDIANTGSLCKNIEGLVKLTNISFKYPKQKIRLLNNINLSAKPGEFIAITGHSASGKTTLFSLLLGINKTIEGDIFFDNKKIEEYNMDHLRQQFGVVLQQEKLIRGSILDNIITSSGVSEEDAWESLKQVGMEKRVMSLPMGVYTQVSPEASPFSGGEVQLLLIARAIIHKPKVLFLDEATSALDNESQARISNMIANLGMTRIVIAHRLSTIKQADRIYFLENGRIAEQGSFNELYQKKGKLYQLAKQSLIPK